MAGLQEVRNHITGEIIFLPDDYSPEKYEIRNIKQVEFQKNWRERGSNQFTFAFQDNIRELLSTGKLTLTSIGAVLVLLPYLDEDGYLKRRTVKGKPYITRHEIITILRLPNSSFERVLRSLKETGIIDVDGTRNRQKFRINKLYHLRGTLPGKVNKVVRVQNRGVKSAYEEGDSIVKLDQIGFLYLLIPHLSYDNCRLVKDINGPEDISNALTITELSERLGLSVKTVEKYLKFKITFKFRDGLYKVPVALSFNSVGNKNRKSVIINPILFRRNKEIDGEIRFRDLLTCFKEML